MASVVNRSGALLSKRILSLNSRSIVARNISTSDKKKDGATVTETIPKDIPDFSKPNDNKNWVTYGFSRTDQKEDLNIMHNFFFMTVTVCFVFGGFYLTYFPDFKEKDWAQREGFLELRRRERLGLPLIERDYIDPATIILPSDEELGDREIII